MHTTLGNLYFSALFELASPELDQNQPISTEFIPLSAFPPAPTWSHVVQPSPKLPSPNPNLSCNDLK